MPASQTQIALPRGLSASVATARSTIAVASLATTVAGATLIAGATAAGPRYLTDLRTDRFPDWIAGPLAGMPELSPERFSLVVLAMLAAYVVALRLADTVRPRHLVVALFAVHAVLVVAPPILSVDAFGYLNYARLDAVHGFNPYEHGAAAAPFDPLYPYLVWHYLPSPYGPAFTAALHPLGLVDFRVSLWLLKLTVAAASLGCSALAWRCARLRGGHPVRAAMLVGLNPVLLVWGVGGAHNDLLVAFLMAVGIERTLAARRPAARGTQPDRGGATFGAGGAALAGAALVKATGGLLVPFALAGERRHAGATTRLVAGLLAAIVATGAVGAALLGPGLLHYPSAVAVQHDLVTEHSVPAYIGSLVGGGEDGSPLRSVATAGFLATFAVALLRTWRGADWIRAAAWTTLAFLLATAWLMPWYIVWVLPLAAIGGGRRLEAAALAATAFIVVTRVPLLLG